MKLEYTYLAPQEAADMARALLKKLSGFTDPGGILPISARGMNLLRQCSPVLASNSASIPTN